MADVVKSWRKSRHSGAQGDCLEVKAAHLGVHVRDSKRPAARIGFSTRAWSAFLEQLAE